MVTMSLSCIYILSRRFNYLYQTLADLIQDINLNYFVIFAFVIVFLVEIEVPLDFKFKMSLHVFSSIIIRFIQNHISDIGMNCAVLEIHILFKV